MKSHLTYLTQLITITVRNFIIANVSVVVILLIIFKLLLPTTLKFFSASEVFFVNSIGLPFNSGSVIAALGGGSATLGVGERCRRRAL